MVKGTLVCCHLWRYPNEKSWAPTSGHFNWGKQSTREHLCRWRTWKLYTESPWPPLNLEPSYCGGQFCGAWKPSGCLCFSFWGTQTWNLNQSPQTNQETRLNVCSRIHYGLQHHRRFLTSLTFDICFSTQYCSDVQKNSREKAKDGEPIIKSKHVIANTFPVISDQHANLVSLINRREEQTNNKMGKC